MRTVRGEVVAVLAGEQPPVIVVKATTANKRDLIVGATLEANAVITRGTHRVGLAEIHVGETVTLGYLKTPDGLTATVIHAR